MTLDDDLLARAQELTGIAEPDALLNAALRSLLAHEASKRLAALGGSDPTATAAPRRRSAPSAKYRDLYAEEET